MRMMKSVEKEFGTAIFKIETGKMAKQANGSVLVTYGDTVVLVATAEKDQVLVQIFFLYQFFM